MTQFRIIKMDEDEYIVESRYSTLWIFWSSWQEDDVFSSEKDARRYIKYQNAPPNVIYDESRDDTEEDGND